MGSDGRHDRTVLAAFIEHRRADPDATAVHYFGNVITRAELDDLSNLLTDCLAQAQVGRADRVAVSLQNPPLFAVAPLATWKLGAVLVPVNPMLRSGELASLLPDYEARVLLAHPQMAAIIAALKNVERLPTLLWSSPSHLAGDLDGPWGGGEEIVPAEGTALLRELRGRRGTSTPPYEPAPTELALLTYTSGTTGPSKGAMTTHANIGYQAAVTRDWLRLAAGDNVLTIAPFFHITGVGLHLALGLGTGLALAMTYRFEPRHVLALIERHSPSFTVGTITAFIAMADWAVTSEPGTALSRMTSTVSGGAAMPAAVVDRNEREFGVYIRNGYGLTETASAGVVVPPSVRAPVDPGSGATAISRPLPGVTVTIVAGVARRPVWAARSLSTRRKCALGIGIGPTKPRTLSGRTGCARGPSDSSTIRVGSTWSIASRTSSWSAGTRCGRAMSKTSSTSIPLSPRPPSSAFRTSTGRSR